MSRAAVFRLIGLFSTVFLKAQETPRVEIFGGYALASIDDSQGLTGRRIVQNGWNAAAAININKTFGVVSDFGGYYGTHRGPSFTAFTCLTCPITFPGIPESNKFHTFMFGPQASFRLHEVTPFVHALFGGAHVHGEDVPSSGFSLSQTGFAWALGGGLDITFSHHMAFRVQGDYLRFNLSTNLFNRPPENNARVSTGVVFRFGH